MDRQTHFYYLGTGKYTSLAFGPSGQPCIAYCSGEGYALKCAQYTGSRWDIRRVDEIGIATLDDGGKNSLAFTPSGRPAISYYDRDHQDLKYAEVIFGK